MAGLMTGISANLAYAKHAKKAKKTSDPNDYEGALRFLAAVSPQTVKAGIAESKKKEEDEKKKKKMKYGLAGGAYSADADKVLRNIKEN